MPLDLENHDNYDLGNKKLSPAGDPARGKGVQKGSLYGEGQYIYSNNGKWYISSSVKVCKLQSQQQ